MVCRSGPTILSLGEEGEPLSLTASMKSQISFGDCTGKISDLGAKAAPCTVVPPRARRPTAAIAEATIAGGRVGVSPQSPLNHRYCWEDGGRLVRRGSSSQRYLPLPDQVPGRPQPQPWAQATIPRPCAAICSWNDFLPGSKYHRRWQPIGQSQMPRPKAIPPRFLPRHKRRGMVIQSKR